MGIINDLDRKLTEYGYGVMKKTKDFSDITKLSTNIKEVERERDEWIKQMGLWTLSQIQTLSPEKKVISIDDAKCHAMIERIKYIDENLDVLKKQLTSLKGSRICPVCHAENDANAVFCSTCGKQFEKEKKEFCTNCGEEITKDQKFCVRCGKKL